MLFKNLTAAKVRLACEDTNTTRQLHYQLRYGTFHGKDSASAASLRHCYAPMTDKLTAA